jgi:hypothetical protein
MKELGASIGEALFIRSARDEENGIWTVGRVWPSLEVQKPNILIGSYLKDNSKFEVGDQVILEKIKDPIEEATVIHFENNLKEETLKSMDLLKMFLYSQIVGTYMIEGNYVSVSIYGNIHKFKLLKIEPLIQNKVRSSSVTPIISPKKFNLNLNAQNSPIVLPGFEIPSEIDVLYPKVYKVTQNTKIQLIESQNQTKKLC